MTRSLALGCALCGLTASGPALSHPHVWVTARAEVVYAADGKVAAVRHRWTFDQGYSAYVTQGLGKDGKPSPEDLQELANTNAQSLADFDYFTHLKANGVKQAFDPPREASAAFENGQLKLTYVLPLKTPASAKLVALEVYDPSFFVAFEIAAGDDAVGLESAPKGCAAQITRPKPADAGAQQNVSEAFFQALTSASTFGAQFANRVIVACP